MKNSLIICLITFFYLIFTQICLAQWQPMNPPEGPSFQSSVDDDAGYVLLTNADVWHWTPGQQPSIYASLPSGLSIFGLCSSAGRIYLSDIGGKNLYSKDRGKTWKNITPLSNWAPETFQSSGARLWSLVYSQTGLWYTSDFGLNWQPLTGLPTGTDKIESFRVVGDTIAVLLTSQFALSVDGGSTWQFHPAPSTPPSSSFSKTQIFYTGGNFFVWYEGPPTRVFRSSDGAAWTEATTPFEPYNQSYNHPPVLADKYQNWLFVSNTIQTWISDDEGMNWNEIDIPGIYPNFIHSGDKFRVSTNLGVFNLNHALEWESMNQFFDSKLSSTANSPKFIKKSSKGLAFVSNSGAAYFSNNLGNSWTFAALVGNYYAAFKGDTITGGNTSRWLISTDGGRHFQGTTPSNSIGRGKFFFGDTLYAGEFSQLKRSTDLGLSYSVVPTPGNAPVGAITGCKGVLYITLNKDTLEVFRSADQGINWQKINTGLPLMNPYNSALYSDGAHVYFGSLYGINLLQNDAWVLIDTDFTSTHYGLAPSTIQSQPNVVMFGASSGQGLYAKPSIFSPKAYNAVAAIPDADQVSGLEVDSQWTFVGVSNSVDGKWNLYRRPTSDFQGIPITGRTYKELFSNHQFDPGEPLEPNVFLSLSSGGSSNSGTSGYYDLFGWLPGDTLRVNLTPPYTSYKPEFYVISPNGGNYDFEVTHPVVLPDWTVYLTGLTPFKPNHTNKIFVELKQTPANDLPSKLHVSLPPFLTVISAAPSPKMVMGNELVWDTIYPSIGHALVALEVWTDSLAALGDTIKIIARLNLNDSNQANNSDTLLAPVVSSFDPNLKECEPASLTPEAGHTGADLHYLIRFQNTGTATAETIRLVDTLPNELNRGTIQFESSSHPFTWNMKPGGVLECLFAGINLPDSLENEPESHGFIRFLIKSNKNLPVGTKIKNTAYIYFDFNSPVKTNTILTGVQSATSLYGVQEKMGYGLQVYPNPATGIAHLRIPGDNRILKVSIFDLPGREILTIRHLNGIDQIDFSALPVGGYFLSVEDELGKRYIGLVLKN